MTSYWPRLLHSGLAAHDWLTQILVIALIAGLWLVVAGQIERRRLTARRRPVPPSGDRA